MDSSNQFKMDMELFSRIMVWSVKHNESVWLQVTVWVGLNRELFIIFLYFS